MVKFIVAAVWLCCVTLGAVLWSAQPDAKALSAEEQKAKPMLGGLDYVKTEVFSIPILGEHGVGGYFLARLVYTAEPEKLAKLSVPAETLLVDQAYTYLYGHPEIDFSDKERIDIDGLRNGLRDGINSRVGEALIHDVMVEQIDFLSKEEIRDNVVRRRTSAPVGGSGGGGKKVASPSSHF